MTTKDIEEFAGTGDSKGWIEIGIGKKDCMMQKYLI